MTRIAIVLALTYVLLDASAARARDAGAPIRLGWMEGDVAGFTPIRDPNGGAQIGIVEYHQRRRGDLLEASRIARFDDGSSDQDDAVARVGEVLAAVEGRSIIRQPGGRVVVDIRIDVAGGRLGGFYEDGGKRHEVDERVELGTGTYWGPLIFLVVKNFDANAEDGRLAFRTVVPTPRPRVLTMELVRDGAGTLERPGGAVATQRYALRPTVGRMVDPFIHAIVPRTRFILEPGSPPAFARYDGPRNFRGQEIRLE